MLALANALMLGMRQHAPNPVSILGSSLIAWWTADRSDLITLSGSAVTSWRDVVAGYDATQATSAARPTYSATGFNGAPGVTFDGIDDELTCTDAALLAALPDGAEPCEMWFIGQQDGLPADTVTNYMVSYGNGVNVTRRIARASVSGVNRARGTIGTGAASPSVTNTTVDFSSRHVIRLQVGATTSSVSVDNGAAASAAIVPATTVSRLRIGANDASSIANFMTGKARDALITGPLTTAQADALTAWALPRRML